MLLNHNRQLSVKTKTNTTSLVFARFSQTRSFPKNRTCDSAFTAAVECFNSTQFSLFTLTRWPNERRQGFPLFFTIAITKFQVAVADADAGAVAADVAGALLLHQLSHVNLFPFTVTQRQDWQGTGSGQRVRRPSDRLPFALQQSERKALPTTVLSPTTGLSSPIIHTSTFIPKEPRPITRIRSTTQQ